MRRNRHFKSDLIRIIGIGATLILLGYLLDRVITATASPAFSEPAVRFAYLGMQGLFIVYVSGLLAKRQHMEQALAKYQAGMDASIDGVFILDKRFECVYLNGAQARLHGYDSYVEMLGRTWRLFYGDDEIRRFEEEVFPVLAAKGEWRGEAVGRKRDGSTFPQEISLTAIDQNSLVCIVRDITEHKKFERELERKARELEGANRELEAFGYSLTHDIRTHLTRSCTAAQLLRDDYGASLDENGRYLANTVYNATWDMERLIKDMMVLSRIVRNELNREAVDLSGVARGIAAALIQADPDRRVEFAIAPDLVAVCDPRLLKVVIDNLFRNAWKYTGMAPEARIEFGSTVGAGTQAFFVRDNGIGFDMKDAEKLFLPFKRLQNAKVFPGSGIGLATVERIVRRHGGEAWGEGEEGKGATFYFTLPE